MRRIVGRLPLTCRCILDWGSATSVREIEVTVTELVESFYCVHNVLQSSALGLPLTGPRVDLSSSLNPREEKKSHLRIYGLKLMLIISSMQQTCLD